MRYLLLLVLLFLCGRADAQFAIFQVTSTIATFQGNPNPTITGITPSITCSRTSSLLTPAFVQCSGSGTTATCTGTIQCSTGTETNPYEDLEFVWSGGNSSMDTFTNPMTSTMVSANRQFGPEATFVYRSAGTFTISLTVRGKSGAAYTSASATQSLTISAFTPSTEYWFAQSGSDSNNCTTISTPCQTLTKFNTLIEQASNQRFNFNCGDTWTGSTGMKSQE